MATAAVVMAVVRRRAIVNEALAKVYGPLHFLFGENVRAREKLAALEKKLLEVYAPEATPFSADEKKAAAEAFLAAERGIHGRVVAANYAKMRFIVARWGHLLADEDYLMVADELAEAKVAAVVEDAHLPKPLRDQYGGPSHDAEILEQIRARYLELSAEARGGLGLALRGGMKYILGRR